MLKKAAEQLMPGLEAVGGKELWHVSNDDSDSLKQAPNLGNTLRCLSEVSSCEVGHVSSNLGLGSLHCRGCEVHWIW